MNPQKYKSVVVPIDVYNRLKDMAASQHRTIGGQFTYLMEKGQAVQAETLDTLPAPASMWSQINK